MQLFILQPSANLQLMAVRNKHFLLFHNCLCMHFLYSPPYSLALVPNKIRILELKEKTLINLKVVSFTKQCEAGTYFS